MFILEADDLNKADMPPLLWEWGCHSVSEGSVVPLVVAEKANNYFLGWFNWQGNNVV